MTALGPDASRPYGLIARTLYDIAHSFDSCVDPEPRLRYVLRLLRRIVPYDRCALLEVPVDGHAGLVVEPDAPEEREGLSRTLTRLLAVLIDEARRGADWREPDLSRLLGWTSASHLSVPLVGLDEVRGMLFVRYGGVNAYTNDHLRLLSVVASQIAAYLTACRLREQEAQIVREHEAARAAAEAENRAKDEFLAILARGLREPLAQIQSAMVTIRDDGGRAPAALRAGSVVEGQVAHLARVLDQLLDVSRLTRDKVDLRKESLTLQAIVTEMLPRVFDLFAQADRSSSEGGLGVGLTLARLFVELHGGSIVAHSEGPGRGSEFVVHLPIGAPNECGSRADTP
jgi:signal transduction histidine kinase